MKRVLLFAGKLSLRGGSLYTASLAGELKLRGYKVAVLCPGGILEGNLEEQRVQVLQAPVHRSLWRNLLYLETYVDLVREFDPDLIHVQHEELLTIGLLVSQRTGVPAVATVHAQVQRHLWMPFHQVPRMVAVSEEVRQSLVTAGHVPRDAIEVIPSGVSASLSALDEIEENGRGTIPVVGTVNRIAPDRGIDLLLQAGRRILDSGLKVHLLVIGEGPAEKEIRRQARELDLIQHLTIVLPRTRFSGMFRPIDVYVSASHREGQGIFLLAAMAEARPVVCTGVGAVLSLLRNGENGLVVPRGDVDALTDGVLTLLRDPGRARSMAVEGFRAVRERFPLHRMVEKTASFYERV